MSSEIFDSFKAYALAFEKGYASDDWKIVGDQLTQDAVWAVDGVSPPIGGVVQGHESVLRAIQKSCDGFDRRFDLREPRILAGPTPIPGGVHFTWVVTYRRKGLPPFELRGEEWDFFRDGKLEFHREKLANVADGLDFLKRHAKELLPVR